MDPRDPTLPSYLAPHLVVRGVLGEGGTAIVYDAFHTRLQTRVAVKVLALTGPGEREARGRLLREAQICVALDDPHFPRIYDVNELADGTPYVVLEYIRGGPLSQLVAEGPLSIDLAVAITREILMGLSVLHRAGIVHRDVKPANVLLQPRGHERVPRVRLVDFGIAKIVAAAREPASLTQHGALVGTPHYMSPEQLRGGDVDARTDLYATAVVLYELLAGRVPFDAPTVSEVIASVLRDPVEPLGRLRPNCPRALEAFVARAMSRDPNQRPASADEMLIELDEACGALRSQLRLRGWDPERPVRQRRWPSTVLALGLLASAAFVVWAVVFEPGSTTRAKDGPHATDRAQTAKARAATPEVQTARTTSREPKPTTPRAPALPDETASAMDETTLEIELPDVDPRAPLTSSTYRLKLDMKALALEPGEEMVPEEGVDLSVRRAERKLRAKERRERLAEPETPAPEGSKVLAPYLEELDALIQEVHSGQAEQADNPDEPARKEDERQPRDLPKNPYDEPKNPYDE